MHRARTYFWPGLLSGERGIVYLDTLLALVLLGMTAVTLLTGLTTASKAAMVADVKTSAESLARTQAEWVKNLAYADNATLEAYSPATIPSHYIHYSANVTAQPLNTPDNGIQKITIVISRDSNEVTRLVTYKVKR
ncbi:MAG: hypothetical protein V1849_00830 [Chloroflexota bacterium]